MLDKNKIIIANENKNFDRFLVKALGFISLITITLLIIILFSNVSEKLEDSIPDKIIQPSNNIINNENTTKIIQAAYFLKG